jgi:hypothetical protein
MKIVSSAIIVIFLAIVTFSCKKGGTWGIRGEGSNETETRDVTGFSGIKLNTDAEVYYINDPNYKVEVNAQNNIRAILTTEVQGNDLVIDMKRRVWKANKVTIYVHAPHMNRLSIGGSGDINSQSTISENDLSLTISGSGNISVPTVTIQTLSTKISGSGSIKVDRGDASNVSHSISGSGNINADYLNSTTVDAKISGSGNITVTATKKLNATISGSGSIRYHGIPTVNANVSGSGSVVALD